MFYAPFVLAGVGASCWIFLRHYDRHEEHRSFSQWVIFVLYMLVRIVYAITCGIDAGYTEYRRVMLGPPPEILNEKQYGRIVAHRV